MSQHKTRLIHTSNNSHKSPRLEALKRQIFYLLTMKSQAILFLLLALVIGETRGQDINPLNLCGPTDDRVLSQDVRQGRIMPVGCTAWMISESVFLTAAHCQENVKVMHFTFGSSDAPLVDQYLVESFVKSPNYTNSPDEIQDDWLVGRLLPNSITSKTPGVAQSEKCNKTGCGWYTLGEVPDEPEGNTITVTGYGQLFDPNNQSAQNQTTHTGRLVNTTTILIYKPDTTSGDSGGPIIHNETGKAIGIHSSGGCSNNSSDDSGNLGTRIDYPPLKQEICNWTNNTAAICSTATPTTQPTTGRPTGQPTTAKPTATPTTQPTTGRPTGQPTTAKPTATPTMQPTTGRPTGQPTTAKPTATLTKVGKSKAQKMKSKASKSKAQKTKAGKGSFDENI